MIDPVLTATIPLLGQPVRRPAAVLARSGASI